MIRHFLKRFLRLFGLTVIDISAADVEVVKFPKLRPGEKCMVLIKGNVSQESVRRFAQAIQEKWRHDYDFSVPILAGIDGVAVVKVENHDH